MKQIPLLNIEIVDPLISDYTQVESRIVVRGIMIKNDQILVVYPNNEMIYGTPGGGVEQNESVEDALRREMLEEVGALKMDIIQYLGHLKTKRVSYDLQTHSINKNKIFCPTHHLFLVNITDFGKQKLVPYEQELDLKFSFISIDKVIEANEQALKIRQQIYHDFYTNQTILFKEIKKILDEMQ